MKKYKIFILSIVALILAFSCFTGFVSSPSAMAQPFDNLFPPQSSEYYYFYLDFSSCGIPYDILEDSLVFLSFNGDIQQNGYFFDVYQSFSLEDTPSVNGVYQFSLPNMYVSALGLSNFTITLLFDDLTSYGIPSIALYDFLDSDFVSIEYTAFVGSNFINFASLPSDFSTLVVAFENRYQVLRTQYNNLDVAYRNQQLQLISETSRANQAEANYNNLLTDYNSLNTQYTTLQGEYEDLENLYEEARDNADHFQGLLKEANAEIDELTADNDRLQGIINNLPPTDLAFGWVGSAFATVDNILSIEIIPNLTFGSLVLIPLVLGVLFFVLRLVRGE